MLQMFIDRDPVFFSKILNYLRTKDIDLRFVFTFLAPSSVAANFYKVYVFV